MVAITSELSLNNCGSDESSQGLARVQAGKWAIEAAEMLQFASGNRIKKREYPWIKRH